MSQMSQITQWTSKHTSIKFKLDSLYKSILDANRLAASQPATYTLILQKLDPIKQEIDGLEHSLSLFETSQTRDLEVKVLALYKLFDKVESLCTGESGMKRGPIQDREALLGKKTVRFEAEPVSHNVPTEDLLQLQTSLMNEQDVHLDVLSDAITRQKDMGYLISEELDVHVELLEEVDEETERLQGRLGSNNNRMNQFIHQVEGYSGFPMIMCLIIVLFVVILIAKKL